MYATWLKFAWSAAILRVMKGKDDAPIERQAGREASLSLTKSTWSFEYFILRLDGWKIILSSETNHSIKNTNYVERSKRQSDLIYVSLYSITVWVQLNIPQGRNVKYYYWGKELWYRLTQNSFNSRNCAYIGSKS